jgi:membrane protease YdiL (CAAX protease family)
MPSPQHTEPAGSDPTGRGRPGAPHSLGPEPARPAVQIAAAFAGLMAFFTILLLLTRQTELVAALVDLGPISVVRVGFAVAMLGLFSLLVLLPRRLLGWTMPWTAPGTPVWATVLGCLLVWPLLQLVAVTVGGASSVTGAVTVGGIGDQVVSVLDPLLVNALPEEIVYRGIALGVALAYLARKTSGGRAAVLALLLSLLIFALGHIPIALFDGRNVLAAMAATVPGGLLYGGLYLLTRNVVLVAVVHGVGNASNADGFWWADGAGFGEPAIYGVLLVVGVLAAAPLLLARRRRDSEVVPAASE